MTSKISKNTDLRAASATAELLVITAHAQSRIQINTGTTRLPDFVRFMFMGL